MSSKTDYFENKLSDTIWRGQPLTIGTSKLVWRASNDAAADAPPTYYFGLLKAMPTDSTAGTEHSGGSYARQGLLASLVNFSGTQSAGSTTASTGTDGTIEINADMLFAGMPDTSISGTNGTVGFGIWDAITGGSLLEYAAITGAPILASAGATLKFSAGALTIQEDN